MQDNEPKGIAFYSVKTDETRYAKLEPQIQGYINSSDLGINASRGQDFGWKLAPEWVEKVKAFRRDENKMERLISRNGGQKVTTVQILYAIYGEQVRNYEQAKEDESSPFEEKYQQAISDKPQVQAPVEPSNDVPEDVAEEDLMPADDLAEAATSDAPASGQVEEVPQGDGTKKPTKAATAKQK